MPHQPTRRAILLGLAATSCAPALTLAAEPSRDSIASAEARITTLEHDYGGRLGVAILDTGSSVRITHRADERFPFMSTFKLMASAAVLARVDAGSERLDRVIAYGPADLLKYAPITKAHVANGGMRLGELCAAAIDYSDNTAANLILQVIGGPAGFNAYAASLGDHVTRLDRTEPDLNSGIPGDDRDTTTPMAMALDVEALFLGKALSATSRDQLISWALDDKVGNARLRAGLPSTWRIGDKTGTGDNATTNTIACLWSPDRAPIVATVYHTGATVPADRREEVHKAIGKLIVETFSA